MPKAKDVAVDDNDGMYEVEEYAPPVKTGPVDASFVTKANALIEEYEMFKREMRTADRRMQQHRSRPRPKDDTASRREHSALIYTRLMMMYEGAKRMMCNRVRLLASMGVALPEFKDGVASLPDTIMTEGPFDTVPSGDAAEEKRIAHKKEQRRALNLSDEADDLTPQDTGDLDEALDERQGHTHDASDSLERTIERKIQERSQARASSMLTETVIANRPTLMGLDLAQAEDRVRRNSLMPREEQRTPDNPDETTVGGIRIVTVPGMFDSRVAAMREITGGVPPAPAPSEPDSYAILRAAGLRPTVTERAASANPALSNIPKVRAEKKSAKSRKIPIRTFPVFTSDEDEDY